MAEDDVERLDWGNDEDEQQVSPDSYSAYAPRDTIGGYSGEDAEDAVSLGGDDEDEREFYAHHSTEQTTVAGNVLLTKSTVISHSTKRDSQRQPTTSSQHARTPSQNQNSESPNSGLRRTHSASTLTPAPMTHALPPKPVLVPPLFPPPSPARSGTRASSMVHRPKKSNGPAKSNVAADGGDPLPPDWEIRYPRDGSKGVYYYNVKTETSTWERPRLSPSDTSPPSKDRVNSPGLSADLDAPLSDRPGRGQVSRGQRRDVASRDGSPPPPNGDLTYADRHYRPGEASLPASKVDPTSRRGDRAGGRSAYLSESTHGRTRSPSPPAGNEARWRPRSASPARERLPRRDQSPTALVPRGGMRDPVRDLDRSAESNWGRSQRLDGYDDVQVAPRSPNRRARRKDDVEPPLRRRKDDIEPPIRRKDDIEPPIRRKDDIEPWVRRKDDIEPPLRRKDDIEPPLRPPPRKQPSSRYENDEWSASRPLHREPSSPRRLHLSLPLGSQASSNARESSRYERPNSPTLRQPGHFPHHMPNDHPSLRRARNSDPPDIAYDNSKRRRLNDDSGSSHRFHPDLPPPVESLPAKPSFAPEESPIDNPPRRRTPLLTQMEQWQENKRHGPSGPESAGPDGRIARTHPDEMDRRLLTPVDDPPIDRRDDRFRTDEPSSARRTGRSPPRDIDPDRLNRPLPTGPGGRRSRFDPPPPPVPDRMEVDASPAPRMPPAPRSATGGMHADRMQPEPPRGPRAMAPRDYSSVSSGTPGFQQPPSPYGSRNSSAPVADTPLAGPGRGRGRPIQPVDDRRWEPNDSGRRPSVSGPPHADNQMAPARRFDDGLAMPRDYPERPIGRAPLNDRRDDRAPPRMSGENVTGPRTSDYPVEHPASNATRSPVDRLRPANNDYGDRRPLPSESDPYDRRRPPFPPPDLLTPGSARNDRAGRRLSVGQDGPARPRMPDPVADRPVNQLPMRPREPPRDGAPPRQSRPGPPGPSPIAPPDSQPRIWQTRDEAQSARAQDVRPNDGHPPRDEDYVARERNGWEPEPPRRRWQAGSNEFDRREARTRSPEMPLRIRPSTPPPPVGNVHRYDEPLVEHPVAGKVHPERARLLAGEVPPPSEEFSRHSRGRRHGRSPNRAFDHGRPFEPDRGLPPRPADATRFGPPREQSPPPMQNGHRPPIGRGGSLLERLTLDDAVPPNEGGSSLRDRVDVGHGDEGGSSHADVMDVDGDGNGDDAHKGGRGPGRRRTGKPRRGRRNGVA